MAALVLAVLVGAAWFLASRRATPPVAPPSPTLAARAPERPRPTPLPSSLATPRPEGARAPDGPRLRVESDVPGASVFLDRKFLGATPIDVATLEPGPHRLNVSADGYEMQVREIDGEDAPRVISIRFREVTLDSSVMVVHKHGLGSCRGTLSASLAGLRYASDHADHAFMAPLAEATLEVDYLQKNLRVKLRGGRTLNFTHPGGKADPLLVFSQDVEKAQARVGGARQPLTAPAR